MGIRKLIDPVDFLDDYLECSDHELLAYICFVLTDILCDVSNCFTDIHYLSDVLGKEFNDENEGSYYRKKV